MILTRHNHTTNKKFGNNEVKVKSELKLKSKKSISKKTITWTGLRKQNKILKRNLSMFLSGETDRQNERKKDIQKEEEKKKETQLTRGKRHKSKDWVEIIGKYDVE